MAEARSEEEEENIRRDTRDQVVRRQSNNSGGRSDRRKPEHRHSQGPLSSLRAAIKRTSTRPTSLSETSRDRERERDRDRRRPEITILSAEPLASTSWFPGASGGLPPPPPPAAQIWGSTIPPSIQPPPSYEEVIREKTQEQVLLPSSSSSTRPSPAITIATQTDAVSDPPDLQVKRPLRPARPPHPFQTNPSLTDDNTSTTNKPILSCHDGANTHAASQRCGHLTELPSPLSSNSGAQSVPWDQSFPAEDVPAAPGVPLERPRPRPRSKVDFQPIDREVKVQTLVKLREDGLATIAARTAAVGAKQDPSQGKYLTELLEAFSADDWGFPDRQSDSSEQSQSDSEEGEAEEDMATLKARIQAFEEKPVADGCFEDSNNMDFVPTKRPEPRPRLQGLPAKSGPPALAPKPKNFLNASKPSNKMFWEEGCSTGVNLSNLTDLKTAQTSQAADESPPSPPKCGSSLVTPKPAAESLLSSQSAPVPAPRPSPPKRAIPVSEASSLFPILPPRPVVAPRASLGSTNPEKSTAVGHISPILPPRPSNDTLAETGNEETQTPAHQSGKTGSGPPSLPNKSAAVTTTRRASAPNLTPKPTRVSPDQNSGPPKPPGPVGRQKAPSPPLRKTSDSQNKPDPPNGSNPSDPPLPPRPASMKLLPLRPPPFKSNPCRPPPPSIGSSLANLTTTPPPKTIPPPSASSLIQSPSLQTNSSLSTNQMPPRASKKGPPLPPRPKPGHPLYKSSSKQGVLILLDDQSPSKDVTGDGSSQTAVTPLINQSQCLPDLEIQPKPVTNKDDQTKAALEGLNLSDSQAVLPEFPAQQKEKPATPPPIGPRCVALFDYEGEDDDELTFSQGDVVALQELVGQEWGRGQLHERVGIFPLSFTEVVEPLPQSAPSAGEVPEPTELFASQNPNSEAWDLALFDFPGQTAEDLSFHKGAVIQVTEHIDAEWKRGRLEGREGLYPVAFTQPHKDQLIPVQHSVVKGVAKFDFTAERNDELTLKVGDIITEMESVDEEWFVGVVDGKRGIVPKNYVSVF